MASGGDNKQNSGATLDLDLLEEIDSVNVASPSKKKAGTLPRPDKSKTIGSKAHDAM